MYNIIPKYCKALVILFLSSSCQSPTVRELRPTPELTELPIESVIVSSDSFIASGVVSTPSCDMLLSDGLYGGIARVRASGAIDYLSPESAAVAHRGAQLDEYTDSTALLWSRTSQVIGVVSYQSLRVTAIAISSSEWNLPVVGSVTGLPGGLIAVAALGEGPPVSQPDPWVPASLIRVFSKEGDVVDIVGRVEQYPGRYLSWLLARSVIGSVGDRIFAIFLSTGDVEVFATNEGDYVATREGFELPAYIGAPNPREEVWVPHWIQIGGDVVHLIEMSQVIAGDVMSDGRIVAVRPYMAKWRRARSRFVPTQGTWEVTEQGLEIYSPKGELERAFVLPTPTVARVLVDRHHRVFIVDGTGLIYVSSVLAEHKQSKCPVLPDTIPIRPQGGTLLLDVGGK